MDKDRTLDEKLATTLAWLDAAWIRMVLAEGVRNKKFAEKDFLVAAVSLASLRQCKNTEVRNHALDHESEQELLGVDFTRDENGIERTIPASDYTAYEQRKRAWHESLTAAQRRAMTVNGYCTCHVCAEGR
jgi:hypothetical protein